jgi:hypothetical protein
MFSVGGVWGRSVSGKPSLAAARTRASDNRAEPNQTNHTQVTEGGDDDEDDAGGVEVFFAPKDPESREFQLLIVLTCKTHPSV